MCNQLNEAAYNYPYLKFYTFWVTIVDDIQNYEY